MQNVYERCCGIDVHKKLIVACFRNGKKAELRKFDTLTSNIKELGNWLLDNKCQMVAMESTGAYWKPIYNILELFGLDVMVVNAHHMRHVSTLHAVVTPILGLSIYFLLLLYLIMYFANLMPIYLYNYS